MDNNAIETLSVSEVKNSIVVCELLGQYIAEGEKEPTWDGSIYIYYDKDKKKEHIKGRLPVQVKGHKCDGVFKDEIKESVSVIDLKNYLHDGGVLYFVVYIGMGGLCKQIYYTELTPVKIRIILSSANNQQTISIPMKKFPVDSNEKTMIVMNCWENCQKQSSFSTAELLSLDELDTAGVLEGISIPVSTVGNMDPITALLKQESYVYARIKGSAIPQPVELLPKDLVTKEELSAKISVAGKQYYDRVIRIRKADSTITYIGESLKITFTSPEDPVTITYKHSKKLRTLVYDLRFMLAYIENGSFSYNDQELLFDKGGADFSGFSIQNANELLEYAEQVVEVLEYLNCKKDIDIFSWQQKDIRNMNILIRAFLEKKLAPGLDKDIPSFIYLEIGELNFLLFLQHIQEEQGTYLISDFFQTEIGMFVVNADGEKKQTSQFAPLKAEDIVKADNMRYDVLLPSFQAFREQNHIFASANAFMLEIIKAYDMSENDDELWNLAFSFSSWIMNAPDEVVPYCIKVLNLLQIVRRKRELSDEEQSSLFSIIENPDSSDDVLAGAYILLGQKTQAKAHFNRLSEEKKMEFTKFPIYHFWE